MKRAAYKQCKTSQELNALTKEERLTRCGFSDYHWSQSGVCTSTQHGLRDNFNHTKQSTVRDNLDQVLTSQQVETMKTTFVPELQLTSVVEDMYKELESRDE